MIEQTVGGIPVLEAERSGRRYVYPADYPNLERIEASIALSSSHDDGDVEGLKVDPDRYPAQDAFFSTGTAQSADFVQAMACVIDPRFEGLMQRVLDDAGLVATLRRVGDHLASGGNVINAVPHGPLLDIGLLHAAACIALTRLGHDVHAGIVISHGIAGRGKRFNDDLVCLADALDWACDKVWYVTPRTENARESTYTELVSGERISQHNLVVRADIVATQDAGGFLITAAPSATSNRVDAAGVNWIESPTPGTLRLMSHPKTQIMLAVGRVLGVRAPSYHIDPELTWFDGNTAELVVQGDALIDRLAAAMNAVDPDSTYRVRRTDPA
jgi:hypothetical protein